nr:hypothetical protein [Tanacetum cinerariifolium]
KKSGAFKPAVKPKTRYQPVAKQSTRGTSNSPKTTHSTSVGKKNVSTSGNGTFSLSNSFEALNVDLIIKDAQMGNNASTSVQEEDDDGKPLENVEYSDAQGSEEVVESVDKEMASNMASKPSGFRYGQRVCWNNGGKYMGMLTTTHTILYVIIWISRKPIKKVDDPVNVDSDSEVDEVFDETVGFMILTSSMVNKSTKSGSDVEIRACTNNGKRL